MSSRSFPSGPGRLAVVVNPAKFDDLTEVKERVDTGCRENGWPAPDWYETTEADPGSVQARQAVQQGATIVCSLGGDGTVRAVAAALLDGDVPIGLLPGGTGNLLARNLDLPLDDLEAALTVVLTGQDRRVDVGMMRCDNQAERIFLVMAGVGMAADMMAGANETLKDSVGWPAYVLSGLRALVEPGFPAQVLDGQGWAVRQAARTVVVGNCGTLTGGLELMPEARLDDGLLDTVVLSPRGLVSWAAILLDLATGHRRGHRQLQRQVSPTVEIRAGRPVEAQLDGDAIGQCCVMVCRAKPSALAVRVG